MYLYTTCKSTHAHFGRLNLNLNLPVPLPFSKKDAKLVLECSPRPTIAFFLFSISVSNGHSWQLLSNLNIQQHNSDMTKHFHYLNLDFPSKWPVSEWVKSLSRVWLCDPVDCSLPGSSVHGILHGKILEWVVISFSRGSSQPRDRTQVSRVAGRCFNLWDTREAQMTSIRHHLSCHLQYLSHAAFTCEYEWERRRKQQPTPVFLPGESQGQRNLVGCLLWGHTESGMTEVT